MHWATKYIGVKHLPGGRGPEYFDCWGLLWLVYANEFGIALPEYPGVTAESIFYVRRLIAKSIEEDWREVETPFDGCGVGMGQKMAGYIHHVGVYAAVEEGKIVHCWEGSHTIADSSAGIRDKGFKIIKFYRHRLWQ
jgi:hypothetical protein